MLSEARCQSTMINDDGEAKPLIRLRIEYSDKDLLFDRRKLEFHVNKLVANNNDVVRFIRKRSNQMDSDSNSAGLDDGDDDVNGFVDIIRAADISKKYHLPTILIKHFDEANDRKRLTMLDEKFFIEKVDTLTKKNQTDSFKDFTENSKQAIRFVTDMALGDNENFKLDDLKEEIRSIKQKIFNDQEYRSRFQWITREPFVKRPFSLLQQKLSNLTVTGNQSSNIGNTGSKIDDDPFYEDDIDMFDVNDKQEKMSKTSDEKKNNKFFDMNTTDNDNKDESLASTSRGFGKRYRDRQNLREESSKLKSLTSFFDMKNFDDNDDPMQIVRSSKDDDKSSSKTFPKKKKAKLIKTVAIEDSDEDDDYPSRTTRKSRNRK